MKLFDTLKRLFSIQLTAEEITHITLVQIKAM